MPLAALCPKRNRQAAVDPFDCHRRASGPASFRRRQGAIRAHAIIAESADRIALHLACLYRSQHAVQQHSELRPIVVPKCRQQRPDRLDAACQELSACAQTPLGEVQRHFSPIPPRTALDQPVGDQTIHHSYGARMRKAEDATQHVIGHALTVPDDHERRRRLSAMLQRRARSRLDPIDHGERERAQEIGDSLFHVGNICASRTNVNLTHVRAAHIYGATRSDVEATLLAEEKLRLAAGLGAAKGRQDVNDALGFMHDEMVLTSPAWGTVARGKARNAETLRRFFRDFPDYSVSLDGHVADDRHLVCWGVIRMTMAPGAYGLQPNGQRIETPAFLRFTFKDGLIASEYFMVDLSAVCAQSGVSTDAVRAFIKVHRAPGAA